MSVELISGITVERSGAARRRAIPSDRLAVRGRVRRGPFLLANSDLEGMPGRHRVPDVAAYASGETGPAVRLRGIADLANPAQGTLCVNFEDRQGHRRISHFLDVVLELGWIGFERGHATGAGTSHGHFRLILPGIPIESGRMDDLACIEFADRFVD